MSNWVFCDYQLGLRVGKKFCAVAHGEMDLMEWNGSFGRGRKVMRELYNSVLRTSYSINQSSFCSAIS